MLFQFRGWRSVAGGLPATAGWWITLLALPAWADVPPAPQPPLAPLACLIVPDRVADIGSPVVGIVREMAVERGDRVSKGQVLAMLRSEVESANAGIARSRVNAQAELNAALAARDLAAARMERTRELHAQNFVSSVALDQAQSEFNIANARSQQVREQLGTSGRELALAHAQLAQRQVRAPFDGVVVERFLNPGERVEEKPLLRIAAMSPLRVEVVAPVTMFGVLHEGDLAEVMPELPDAMARNARVTRIDRVLDPASNTFRVRLEIDNADASLPAGLRCKVVLGGVPASAVGRPLAGAVTHSAADTGREDSGLPSPWTTSQRFPPWRPSTSGAQAMRFPPVAARPTVALEATIATAGIGQMAWVAPGQRLDSGH